MHEKLYILLYLLAQAFSWHPQKARDACVSRKHKKPRHSPVKCELALILQYIHAPQRKATA